MNRRIVLTAVMLACLNGYAQQPPTAFSFRAVLSSGATIGGHTFTDDTTLDGVALNDQGDVAFVARWLDASGTEHTGLFTSRELVASDGDVTGGKTLVHIKPDSLAINAARQVAFEALYTDPALGDPPRLGIFLGRQFACTLDAGATGHGPDFTLTDDGKVIPRWGISSAQPAAAVEQTPAPPAQKKPGLMDRFHINTAAISKHLPITLAPAKQQTPEQKPAPVQPAQSKPAQPPAPVQLAAPPTGSCSLPAFPLPPEWTVGGEMNGPIASHVFDPAASGRTYLSPYYGILNTPFRTILFGSNCQPLLIAIGDGSARGRFEVWSPLGMVTRQKPEGFYEFKGFAGNVQSSSFLKPDAMRVNKRGQVLIPVSLSPQGYALLLGTPTQ